MAQLIPSPPGGGQLRDLGSRMFRGREQNRERGVPFKTRRGWDGRHRIQLDAGGTTLCSGQ